MLRRNYLKLLGIGSVGTASVRDPSEILVDTKQQTSELQSMSETTTTAGVDQFANQIAAFDAKIDDNYGPNSAAEYHSILRGCKPAGGLEDGQQAELVALDYLLTIYFEDADSGFTASVMEWELSKAEAPAVIGVRSNHFTTGTYPGYRPDDVTKGDEEFDDWEYSSNAEVQNDVIAFDCVMAASPLKNATDGYGGTGQLMRARKRVNFRDEFGSGYIFGANDQLHNHMTTSHKPTQNNPYHVTVYWQAYWDVLNATAM